MQIGGSREYSGFGERSGADERADERADLAQWAAPLVSDRIAYAYDAFLGGKPSLCEPLWRQHGGFWRLILGGETARARVARAHLLALAHIVRLGPETIDAIDRLVLDELVDVVATRFQRSPASMRRYSRLLIDAAATLTETRLLAA